jgi:hypothetical protein
VQRLILSYSWVAESQATISAEETFDEVACLWLNMGWELIVAIHDLLVNAKRVVIIERRVASKHFEDENSESPPVDILVVAFRLDDFRRQVLRRAT